LEFTESKRHPTSASTAAKIPVTRWQIAQAMDLVTDIVQSSPIQAAQVPRHWLHIPWRHAPHPSHGSLRRQRATRRIGDGHLRLY